MKEAAVITVSLLLVFTCGTVFAVNTSPVQVVNTPAQAVPVTAPNAIPVTGSVGITSGTVGVTNTQASPLYVVTSGSAAPATSLLHSGTITFTQSGTINLGVFDVSSCAKIRVGVATSFQGDTSLLTIVNDLGIELDEFVVGVYLGGSTTSLSKVYDIPGVQVGLSLTLSQPFVTGQPTTWGLWCR